MVRGVRGATRVENDTSEEILQATEELLSFMVEQNGISPDDIAGAFFTVTPDLNSQFPARAARTMGWNQVPLMCFQEINVAGALPKCIRILILYNTSVKQEQVQHVYLRGTSVLRDPI
ncbi:MAG: chorismate mutase [Chitinophagales bacterium]